MILNSVSIFFVLCKKALYTGRKNNSIVRILVCNRKTINIIYTKQAFNQFPEPEVKISSSLNEKVEDG